jgi:hypothetical protein
LIAEVTALFCTGFVLVLEREVSTVIFGAALAIFVSVSALVYAPTCAAVTLCGLLALLTCAVNVAVSINVSPVSSVVM